MTQYLPPNLLALFAPRDPLPHIAPLDKLPWEKKHTPYSGVAQCIQEFEDPKDTPPPTRVETKEERKERKRKEHAEQVAYKLEQDLALWIPGGETTATSDPFKTLFITRINFDTSESKLRREFESFGPVRKIHMVQSKRNGKPRGYAFVEYEHERDMHSAYKHADGKKIDGRRVLVDVERGRTIKGWRPRRLGGGLGGTRKGGPDVNTKYSGREDNMRADRSRSRSPVRSHRRSRSRERAPRRRSRSREPRRRSRERETTRGHREEPEVRSKRRGRSRSPRDRKRSRSRDRKRSRRSRSRERKPRIDPDLNPELGENEQQQQGAGGGGGGGEGDDNFMDPAQIKPEPVRAGYDKYAAAQEAEGDDQNNGYDEEYNNGNNQGNQQQYEEYAGQN